MYKQVIISILLLGCFSLSIAQDDAEKTKEVKRPSWSSGLPERQSTKDLNKPDFKPEIDNEVELDMSEFGIKPKAEIDIELPVENEMPVSNADASEIEEPTTQTQTEPVIEEPPVINEPVVDSAPEIEAETDIDEPTAIQQTVSDEAVEQIVEEPTAVNDSKDLEIVPETVEEQALKEQLVSEPPQSEQQAKSETTEQNDETDLSFDDTDLATDVTLNKYVWKIVKQAPVNYPVRAAIDNLEGWVDVEVTINAAGEVVSASTVKYSRKGRVFGKAAVQSVNDWLFDPPSNYGINAPQTRIYRIEFEL